MDIFTNGAGNTPCPVGILVMEDIRTAAGEERLLPVRYALEDAIRSKYASASRGDLKALHPMDTYIAYYKKFGYTYHVLPQLESVIKGKPIPSGIPLVAAMFMAELKNMLLTAGHDLDKIKHPIGLAVSAGEEGYTAINGKDVIAVTGDFMLADQEGIVSSILRGPDLRTAITEETKRVVYTVYAPPGVEEDLVRGHLKDIESYVRTASEQSVTRLCEIF